MKSLGMKRTGPRHGGSGPQHQTMPTEAARGCPALRDRRELDLERLQARLGILPYYHHGNRRGGHVVPQLHLLAGTLMHFVGTSGTPCKMLYIICLQRCWTPDDRGGKLLPPRFLVAGW